MHALCEREEAIASVEHLQDRLGPQNQDIADTDWIEDLASSGDDWIIITQDKFKKDDAEKKSVTRSGLQFYYLDRPWSKSEYWDKCIRLISWLPGIIAHAGRNPAGVYEIPFAMGTKGSAKITLHKRATGQRSKGN